MHRPHPRLRSTPGALAAIALGLAAPVGAQTTDHAPADVEGHLAAVRAYLGEMHGPVAERVWETHTTQLTAPHEFPLPPRPPRVPDAPPHASALDLIHHQAVSGSGTLGRLHGPLTHPIGLDWFPHSMFAEGGGMYGRWGHARLLHAVHGFVLLQRGRGA